MDTDPESEEVLKTLRRIAQVTKSNREDARLSLSEVAEAIGVDDSTLRRFEEDPELDTLTDEQLIHLLDLTRLRLTTKIRDLQQSLSHSI
jgi:transcriptional regulator with XRE-family HTH domain